MTSPLASPTPFLDALIPCSGCRNDRHPDMFLGRARRYRTCTVCRYRQIAPSVAPVLDEMVFLSALPIEATFFSEGPETHQEMDIFVNDDMMALDDNALVATIFDAIEDQCHELTRHHRSLLSTRSL
jgi:hypothetical protein